MRFFKLGITIALWLFEFAIVITLHILAFDAWVEWL